MKFVREVCKKIVRKMRRMLNGSETRFYRAVIWFWSTERGNERKCRFIATFYSYWRVNSNFSSPQCRLSCNVGITIIAELIHPQWWFFSIFGPPQLPFSTEIIRAIISKRFLIQNSFFLNTTYHTPDVLSNYSLSHETLIFYQNNNISSKNIEFV